ncbi:hypothetical protein CDAR_305741 [Caerostris darwini]|uniref:Uncharacterized protein n=1 Tax=Caerostris darwini TaxID=1538125 RepID=A0AAV4VQT8_9ARAC|nr:hypothetical protein CDAR_305741 [Caerostris darwini]
MSRRRLGKSETERRPEMRISPNHCNLPGFSRGKKNLFFSLEILTVNPFWDFLPFFPFIYFGNEEWLDSPSLDGLVLIAVRRINCSDRGQACWYKTLYTLSLDTANNYRINSSIWDTKPLHLIRITVLFQFRLKRPSYICPTFPTMPRLINPPFHVLEEIREVGDGKETGNETLPKSLQSPRLFKREKTPFFS